MPPTVVQQDDFAHAMKHFQPTSLSPYEQGLWTPMGQVCESPRHGQTGVDIRVRQHPCTTPELFGLERLFPTAVGAGAELLASPLVGRPLGPSGTRGVAYSAQELPEEAHFLTVALNRTERGMIAESTV